MAKALDANEIPDLRCRLSKPEQLILNLRRNSGRAVDSRCEPFSWQRTPGGNPENTMVCVPLTRIETLPRGATFSRADSTCR